MPRSAPRSPIHMGLMLLFISAAPSSADMVSIPASKDNTLYGDSTRSNGAGDYIFVGVTFQGDQDALRRTVMKFDLFPVVPIGAMIDSVKLELHMSRTIVTAKDVSLHRLTSDWGEGASNASGPEGRGTNATTGDATWTHRFWQTDRWATPGGDYDPTPSATTPVASIGFYEWSSPGMAADVQAWVDNPMTNFGWIFVGDESSLVSPTAKRFDSRTNPIASFRPRLDVYFTPVGCARSPATLDFDTVTVGDFAERSFTIRSTDAGSVDGDVTLSCPEYSIVSGGGPFSLASGESLVVTVRYEPSAQGTHACTVSTGNILCGGVSATGFAQLPPPIPAGLTLGFPGPNPFASEATITFSVDRPGAVSIAVYDVRGARVATIADGWYGRGEHSATWDGRARSGNRVSRGTYFIRATFRGDERVRKITVVRD